MIDMRSEEKTDIELELLLDAIYRIYHYDFRRYARSSPRRRVDRAQSALGGPTITHLLNRIAHERSIFADVLPYPTIQVSDIFRDPSYFRVPREE